jgi:hypothetical protein
MGLAHSEYDISFGRFCLPPKKIPDMCAVLACGFRERHNILRRTHKYRWDYEPIALGIVIISSLLRCWWLYRSFHSQFNRVFELHRSPI